MLELACARSTAPFVDGRQHLGSNEAATVIYSVHNTVVSHTAPDGLQLSEEGFIDEVEARRTRSTPITRPFAPSRGRITYRWLSLGRERAALDAPFCAGASHLSAMQVSIREST
jgi:hypothetical protein